MRQSTLIPQYVDCIPERLSEGVLYICERYRTAAHKCCCGCGEEVVTPLTPADWSIRKEENTVTLHPSIGNWSFACKSHYWIRKNQVVWARTMSKQEINRVRTHDLADKRAYAAAVNRRKEKQGKPEAANFKPRDNSGSALNRLWQVVVRWWNS